MDYHHLSRSLFIVLFDVAEKQHRTIRLLYNTAKAPLSIQAISWKCKTNITYFPSIEDQWLLRLFVSLFLPSLHPRKGPFIVKFLKAASLWLDISEIGSIGWANFCSKCDLYKTVSGFQVGSGGWIGYDCIIYETGLFENNYVEQIAY